MIPRQPVLSAFALLLLVSACSGNRSAATPAAQLQFGVDMARRGLWQEALFRFHQAERMEPGNPRVYNNLAVAYEANGQFDKALDYYQKALRAAPDNRETRGNYARFVEFYQAFKPKDVAPGTAAAPAAPAAPPAAGPRDEPLDSVPSTPPAAPPHEPAATPEARPQEPEEEPPAPPPARRTA